MGKNFLNILVVDDDPFVCEMLGSILESAEYDVCVSENGKAALDLINSDGTIDLVVSDMNMPEIDGLELLNLLRKSGSEIPIIILTGNNEISIAIDAMKCGANDYILKDENIQDTFLIAVEKVMDKHRLEMQNKQLLAELELKNEELRRIALIDGLTGIANRRYFDDFSDREWRRAVRESTPFAIIMLDIDYFKLYNDSYGHQTGDDCLRSVAQALARALRRPSDLIARYGGEEFVAILPNTELDGAQIVAEYMEKNIAKLKIRHSKSKVSDVITVSMGIGSVIPERGSGVLELLSLVDKALYEAKRQGRNCIKSVDWQSAEGKLVGTKN